MFDHCNTCQLAHVHTFLSGFAGDCVIFAAISKRSAEGGLERDQTGASGLEHLPNESVADQIATQLGQSVFWMRSRSASTCSCCAHCKWITEPVLRLKTPPVAVSNRIFYCGRCLFCKPALAATSALFRQHLLQGSDSYRRNIVAAALFWLLQQPSCISLYC